MTRFLARPIHPRLPFSVRTALLAVGAGFVWAIVGVQLLRQFVPVVKYVWFDVVTRGSW